MCGGSQVQLLISDSDVENYKQIKSDLDVLRLLVEKSELWVFKKKGDGKKEKIKTEEDETEPAPAREVCFTLFNGEKSKLLYSKNMVLRIHQIIII